MDDRIAVHQVPAGPVVYPHTYLGKLESKMFSLRFGIPELAGWMEMNGVEVWGSDMGFGFKSWLVGCDGWQIRAMVPELTRKLCLFLGVGTLRYSIVPSIS